MNRPGQQNASQQMQLASDRTYGLVAILAPCAPAAAWHRRHRPLAAGNVLSRGRSILHDQSCSASSSSRQAPACPLLLGAGDIGLWLQVTSTLSVPSVFRLLCKQAQNSKHPHPVAWWRYSHPARLLLLGTGDIGLWLQVSCSESYELEVCMTRSAQQVQPASTRTQLRGGATLSLHACCCSAQETLASGCR